MQLDSSGLCEVGQCLRHLVSSLLFVCFCPCDSQESCDQTLKLYDGYIKVYNTVNEKAPGAKAGTDGAKAGTDASTSGAKAGADASTSGAKAGAKAGTKSGVKGGGGAKAPAKKPLPASIPHKLWPSNLRLQFVIKLLKALFM